MKANNNSLTQLVFLWILRWIVFVLLLIVGGAIAGGLLFVTVGSITHEELSVWLRLQNGLRDGANYFGVWAGGLSIVLCAIKGHNEYEANQVENGKTGAL